MKNRKLREDDVIKMIVIKLMKDVFKLQELTECADFAVFSNLHVLHKEQRCVKNSVTYVNVIVLHFVQQSTELLY